MGKLLGQFSRIVLKAAAKNCVKCNFLQQRC